MIKGQRFGLTSDLRTDLNNESFMSLTLHFITEDMEMTSIALECTPFEGRHTGENIAKGMNAILERHGLSEDDIEGAVTDNASNIVAGLRDFTNITRFPCMAHTLDLCAKHFLDSTEMQAIVKQARGEVGHFKHSSKAPVALKSMCDALNIADRTLKQDVATRWGSTNIMLQSCLPLRPALDAMSAVGNFPPEKNLSPEQWDVIECCCREPKAPTAETPVPPPEGILNLIASSQQFLEGEKFVTLSFVPVIISTLKRAMDQAYDDDSLPAAARAGIGHIRNDFYDRFYGIVLDDDEAEFETTYMVEGVLLAAVVDPRTKTLDLLSEEDKERAKTALDRRMKGRKEELRIAAAGAATSASPSSDTPASRGTESAGVQKEASGRNFLQRIRQQREAEISSAMPRPPASAQETSVKRQEIEKVQRETEMIGFLDTAMEPALAIDENPLKWWARNAHKYPLIANVARNVLAVPASSGPSERVFSQSGLVMTQRRNRLKPERLETLMFLKGSWEAAEKFTRSAVN